MYNFDNLSDNELVEVFKDCKQFDSRFESKLMKSASIELDRRIHAIVPNLTWVVLL